MCSSGREILTTYSFDIIYLTFLAAVLHYTGKNCTL